MKESTKKRRAWLKNRAKELNADLPWSEVWFNEHYSLYKSVDDIPNKAWARYIPDIINHRYKYIIEVDGSVHQLPKVMKRDKKKDKKFQQLGYAVIRVTAYNMDSFNEAMIKLEQIRQLTDKHYKHPKRIR